MGGTNIFIFLRNIFVVFLRRWIFNHFIVMESSRVIYIGVDDKDIDLFESQYVVPKGMCYNSYLVKGEKIAVMDTADRRKGSEWMANLEKALEGATPDYLVVQHMEPDHSGSIALFMEKYPQAVIVCSLQASKFITNFNEGLKAEMKVVKEGDTLDLGEGMVLSFIAAPMVHWPEVIMTYLAAEKTLFSADGFGKFGVYNADEDNWTPEARRYYFNICGKYGDNVAAVLKKAAGLEIGKIAPLHGPVLEGAKMAEALRLYTLWSAYQPEEPETVLVAHSSIHGHTKAAALKFAEMLREKGAKVIVKDLTRDDMAGVVEDAFTVGKIVLASSTYDAGLFPPMHYFLYKLSIKGFRKRRIGIIENGTWAPMAAKHIKLMLEGMKEIELVEPVVSLKSSLKSTDAPQMEALANAMLA